MAFLGSGGRLALCDAIEWAHQIADALEGEAGVMAGRLDPCVAEQDPDVADIHAGLQQMGGEAMAQGVRRDVLADPGIFSRFLHRPTHDIDRQGLALDDRAGEQPGLGLPGLDIPLPQHRQDLRRENGVAVFPALGLLDADDHAGRIDVGNFEVDQFGNAQPSGIAQAEHHLEFEAGGVVDQAGDLVGTQRHRQLIGAADVFGDAQHRLVGLGDGIEEAQPGDGLIDAGDRQAAWRQFETKQAQVVGRRLVGRAMDERGELSDALDVGELGLGCETADGHVVDQALTERADGCGLEHRKLLFWVRPSMSSLSRWAVSRRHFGVWFWTTFRNSSVPSCAGLVAMAVIGTTSLAETQDELDPQMHAYAFARRIGEVEAHAQICKAPPVTYDSTLRDARAVLPDQYRKGNLDPVDIEQDIAKGKADFLAMHQANPSWPSCNVFRRMVAALRCWVLIANGKIENGCPTLPPYDRPGWQDRFRTPPPADH